MVLNVPTGDFSTSVLSDGEFSNKNPSTNRVETFWKRSDLYLLHLVLYNSLYSFQKLIANAILRWGFLSTTANVLKHRSDSLSFDISSVRE